MSHEYIASISLGDQSSNPFLQASLTADITEPVTCDNLFWTVENVKTSYLSSIYIKKHTNLLLDAIGINVNRFNKIGHPFDRLSTQRSLEHS
jgi:hypothetical protein